MNNTINPVNTVFSIAERKLCNYKRSQHPMAGVLAQGEIAAILRFLGEVYLTSEQQEQLERIMDLHDHCNYPRSVVQD